MKRITFLLLAVATVACTIASLATRSGQANREDGALYVTEIPAGYREWRLVSVAHEEGAHGYSITMRAISRSSYASLTVRAKV